MKIDLIFQKKYLKKLIKYFGGESEIRTHERVAPLPVFKTGAFNRSAISPIIEVFQYKGKFDDVELYIT